MEKLATITPINCITKEQDGAMFSMYWNGDEKTLVARFEDGSEEIKEERPHTLKEAIDIVYSCYAQNVAFIYEGVEIDIDPVETDQEPEEELEP